MTNYYAKRVEALAARKETLTEAKRVVSEAKKEVAVAKWHHELEIEAQKPPTQAAIDNLVLRSARRIREQDPKVSEDVSPDVFQKALEQAEQWDQIGAPVIPSANCSGPSTLLAAVVPTIEKLMSEYSTGPRRSKAQIKVRAKRQKAVLMAQARLKARGKEIDPFLRAALEMGADPYRQGQDRS